MKPFKAFNLATLALAMAAAVLCPASAQAQVTPVSYAPDDLLLGFRSPAATQDYIVNLGQASQFTEATSAFTVPGLGDIKADLDAVFGSIGADDWKMRADVFWSISGTPGSFAAVGNDPLKTLYATKTQATPGTFNSTAARWTRQSDTAQGSATTKMNRMSGAYVSVSGITNNSTANSSKAIVQDTTATNSYASCQPGGTTANSGPAPGTSFAIYSPTIENTFTNGTAGSILELYRMVVGTGTDSGAAGDLVGTFSINDSGSITFTPSLSPTVTFSSATYSVSEAVPSGKVTIMLTRGGGSPTRAFDVKFKTMNGTAVGGTDFTTQLNTLVSFGANEMSKTVDVQVANRAGESAGDRSFTVNLSNATNGVNFVSPSTATVTILASATAVKVENTTYSVAEDGGNLAVKLLRVGPAVAFTATVNTADGTGGSGAVAGTDYTAQTNLAVDFLATDTEKTVMVPILNRTGIQGDRTFTVGITAATGGVAVAAQSTATVTITDHVISGSVAFSAATYQKAKDAANDVLLTITANRTGGSEGAVSVDVVSTGGTATDGTDFTLPSSTVTLNWADADATAKTFDITIKKDGVIAAGGETLLLALQNAVGGVTLGTPNTATVTIVNGDLVAPTVTLTAPKPNAKITAATVTFTGTATDNVGVAKVEVTLDGGAPQQATLTGSPTNSTWTLVTAAEQGLNNVSVKSFDAAGNASTAATVSFTFTNLRPLLAGKYNGLLVAAAGAAAPFDQTGLIAVTATPTGKFTGKVTLSGVVLPISGTFLTGGDARFGKTLTPTFDLVKKATPASIPLGSLALTLDTGAGLKITGTLKNGATTLATIPNADLAVYTPKKNPILPQKNVPTTLLDPTREKGKYTSFFQAEIAPNNNVPATDYPQGHGYASVTISPVGTVKIVGKLADGSTINYKNALSNANTLPVYLSLYTKKGFLTGEITFTPTATETDATGPNLKWFKPSGLLKQAYYPNGWPVVITTDFFASKYLVPKTPPASVLPGLGADDLVNGNATLTFSDGKLNPSPLNKNVNITVANKVTNAPATDKSFSLKLTAATGLISGSFTHTDLAKPAYKGVIFQKGTNPGGFGYFLSVVPKTAGAPTGESGGVSLTAK